MKETGSISTREPEKENKPERVTERDKECALESKGGGGRERERPWIWLRPCLRRGRDRERERKK